MARLALALACSLVCLALAIPSSAQEQQAPQPGQPPAHGRGAWASSTPEQRAKQQTDLMKDKLALSSDQIPKVEAINLDAANKVQAAFGAGGSRGEKMRAVKKIQDEKEAALKGVLTPGQFEKFQAARDEFRHKVAEHAKEKAAGTP